MNEVEKLYKNAGIEPTHYDACVLEDKYWNNEELANQYGTFDGYLSFECPNYGEGCYSTCEYAYDKDEYPPFTAEKQLELIKLFAKREVYINYQENKYYIFAMNIGGSAFGENLENALARYINKVWQDLTDAERTQIKEILE